MADAARIPPSPITERAERKELQQEWIAASADYSRRANEALTKAADVLAVEIPGRRPDGGLAGAWAALGQGWAALSHAEAARSIAAAASATGQTDVNLSPSA